MKNKTVFSKILTEVNQSPSLRAGLIKEIEKRIDRTVVSFFTSFEHPVMIQDSDADMLEQVLQATSIKNGIALIISSPGGLGIAAERILNICRTYSDTGEFWAVVPGKAKSAATLICFGASKIIMSRTSELGPVDPQKGIADDKGDIKPYSLCNIVKSYEKLFKSATRLTKGRLEPYLQQLSYYDPRSIEEYRAAIELSKDISIKALKSGMLSSRSYKAIESTIEIFLTPETTKTHGRPIYAEEALKCGLSIEVKDVKDPLWSIINELYVRSNYYVTHIASKCIETGNQAAYAPLSQEER